MTRPRALAVFGVVLGALLLALLAAQPHGPSHSAAPAGIAVGQPTDDAAVVPARVGDDGRRAMTNGPRGVVLPAVLAVLIGLPALLRRTARPSPPGRRPLRARRHAITLRAPPALPA